MPIRFYEQEVQSKLTDKRKLGAFLQSTIQAHKPEVKKVTLTYIFVSDEALLAINKQFLNHDTYTDIITFDLSSTNNHLEGEIYISVDRVRDNAEGFKTTYQQELHRVIFHGMLHLCGFKDKSAKDQAQMREQEDACIEKWYNQ
jgi:rRNA maturation RNase YbeY